jgi:hypothetical protein
MLSDATSDGRFSSSFGRSVVLIGSLFVVGLLTFGIVASVGQSTFWLGGKHITLNPWYSTLLVDFFFVIFSAGLAQYADPKRDESHSARISTRAACIACFMVSAATLAPMASYAATIWRKLAGGAEYQATIVSLLICNAYPKTCQNIYFYLVALLAGTSLAIAFWAAAILRRIEVDETGSHGTWVMRGAFPLGASVFLFSATTLFHQGWDLGISENNPAGEIFYLILIVVWLTAALFFSALALFAAKAIGRVTRRVLRHLGRWLLVGLSSLASITLFAAKAIGRVTSRVLRHLGRWLLVGLCSIGSITMFTAKAIGRVTSRVLRHLGRWLLVGLCSLAAIAAWNFANLIAEHIRQWPLIPEWLLAVVLCLAVGIICAVAWGLLVQPGIAYLRGASPTGLRWITGPWRVILEGRARHHWRRPDQRRGGAGSRRTDRKGGKRGTRYPGDEGRGVPVDVRGPWTREGASTSIAGPWNPPAERRWQRGRRFLWAYFVKFVIAMVAATRALGQWLSRASTSIAGPWNPPAGFRWQRGLQLVLAHFVKFVRALVAATRALGEWLSPASQLFKCLVLLLSLPTVPYSLVPTEVPQTQEIPNEPERAPQEPITPSLKKPLLFTRAKFVCPNHEFLAWPYYDVELHFSITSCSFTEGSLDPCKAKAIVVVGRASTGGAVEVESQRSLDRGSLLAHMLKRNLLQRCENGTGIRWFVLNVGQYAGQTLKGRQVAQREVSVFIADGDADLDGIGNALEQFVETQPILSEYTNCDLYALEKLPRKSSPVRRLRCGRLSK